jgi:hypothetical protein
VGLLVSLVFTYPIIEMIGGCGDRQKRTFEQCGSTYRPVIIGMSRAVDG